MYLFLKYIIISFILFISLGIDAQPLGKMDVRTGVAPFLLGAVRTQLDSSIQLGRPAVMGWLSHDTGR